MLSFFTGAQMTLEALKVKEDQVRAVRIRLSGSVLGPNTNKSGDMERARSRTTFVHARHCVVHSKNVDRSENNV